MLKRTKQLEKGANDMKRWMSLLTGVVILMLLVVPAMAEELPARHHRPQGCGRCD